MWHEIVVTFTKLFSQNLPERAMENHEKPQVG